MLMLLLLLVVDSNAPTPCISLLLSSEQGRLHGHQGPPHLEHENIRLSLKVDSLTFAIRAVDTSTLLQKVKRAQTIFLSSFISICRQRLFAYDRTSACLQMYKKVVILNTTWVQQGWN